MIDALFKVAASCVQGALAVLLIMVAFGMMIGGKKGAMWVINTALAPIKAVIEKRIAALIYVCMFVIVSYYVGAKIAHALGL